MRVLLLLTLILAGCAQQSSTVEIIAIEDQATGARVIGANIFILPDDIAPGEDGGIFKDVNTPVLVPIETGKCTYILVEAEGYKDHERAFCPTDEEHLRVEVVMGPVRDELHEDEMQG